MEMTIDNKLQSPDKPEGMRVVWKEEGERGTAAVTGEGERDWAFESMKHLKLGVFQ
jgi:hypothetical protein